MSIRFNSKESLYALFKVTVISSTNGFGLTATLETAKSSTDNAPGQIPQPISWKNPKVIKPGL